MKSPSPPRPRTRRSSFFEPRKSLQIGCSSVPEDKNNIPTDDVAKNNPDDLVLYNQKLKTEYDAWRSLYRSRKIRAQSLKRKFDNTEHFDTTDESHLREPEEFKEILQNKPDIKKIIDESIQLCADWDYAIKVNKILIEKNQRVINHITKSVAKTKTQLFENSTVNFE